MQIMKEEAYTYAEKNRQRVGAGEETERTSMKVCEGER